MASILSITEFFKIKLSAPLLNSRWSWGAVKSDGSGVYLSIWQDEIKRDDPKDPQSPTWVNVLWDEKAWIDSGGTSMARDERVRHLDLVKSGVPAYGVIKVAKNIGQRPRQMKEYNSEYLVELKNEFRMTDEGHMLIRVGNKVIL